MKFSQERCRVIEVHLREKALFAFIVTKSKGQKILEGSCGVSNFPKKQ